MPGRGLVGLLEEREKIRARLESLLDPPEAREALRDHHARRRPRPCGLTIHTGIGCSYGCIYCYVPDMGFPMKPRPYPLTPLQMAYAVASNPYFLPGPQGTLLALGSVTEPFLGETLERSLGYIEAFAKHLGNPVQASTKAALGWNEARRIAGADPRISILVTIITLEKHGSLEPGAPSPLERLETIHRLSRLGVHVALFLRPIIPGVNEEEIPLIVERAAEAGARGVVAGMLRVTKGILSRLELAGFSTGLIRASLTRRPRNPRDQVPTSLPGVKELVRRVAERHGIKYYPSACSANIDAHRLGCNACRLGPCGPGRPPKVEADDIAGAAELLGAPLLRVSAGSSGIRLVFGRRSPGARVLPVLVQTYYKRPVTVDIPG